ncbi:MAG: flagellar hook-basal body protein [Bacteriovoracales bacterium]|nr:flagellar hook-basal body protein [Bacteriovoracales bacterium]
MGIYLEGGSDAEEMPETFLKDIWIPLSAAIAQQNKVDVIANNVANANTSGFKKDRLVFKEYLTVFEKGLEGIDLPRKEWAPEDFYRSQGGEKAYVKVAASFTSFEQGALKATENPLDIGINGKGFIKVLSPRGVRYTRSGHLSLSSNGLLVNDKGFPVLGIPVGKNLKLKEEGEVETLFPKEKIISLKPGKVVINLQGDIFVNGDPVARISVAEFKDINSLRKEGRSLFINRDRDNIIIGKIGSTIHQGFIEDSNVNAVEEMSELIKANRHFESIQRAVKNYSNISEKAVNEILKF